jgi:hypothetical protein
MKRLDPSPHKVVIAIWLKNLQKESGSPLKEKLIKKAIIGLFTDL